MRSSCTAAYILRLIMAIFAVGLSACAPYRSIETNMKENPVIANLKPWCIGRMIFDRPAESSMSYEKYTYAGNDIAIRQNVSQHTFMRMVEAKEAEFRSRKRTYTIPYKEMLAKGLKSMDIETSAPWLETMASPSPQSRLFVFKKDEDVPKDVFQGEGYILAATTQLTLSGLLGRTAIQRVLRDDSDWYRQTSYREDWSVPTERGFCIKGALIGGVARSTESVDQTILLMPGRPATFIITMRNSFDIDQQASLLKTVPDLRRELDGRLLLSKVKVLRERKREFAGMQAEEVLLSMKEDGVEVFRFHLMAPGTEDDRGRPYTEIQLDLGAEPSEDFPAELATSPVDEAGALQAWDTLLDSFRLRPGAL
ncbi:hypothetical protein SAMN04488595_10584 [Ralstonia sp. 25mfcol4.1]|nr:hypothetical protein SAMN04488595_10584 [Ralstonia sp. 25mfcol4.1]